MSPTKSEGSKRAVIAAWQAFARRDPQEIAAAFTEDAEWLAPKDNATALAMNPSHHMIGRAAIKGHRMILSPAAP